jgi:hypothetical protein
MAKDRNILCIHYIRAGVCDLGKECHAYNEMQKCNKYKKDEKRKPFRVNNKKQKLDKIRRNEKWN